ncbi:TPA: helix-turn-helix transcriptional regulator [Streptococcus suis]|nr:YafY family transcriptional regulator [Enterococcus faecalis]
MKIDRHMGIISYLIDKQKTTAKELASLFNVSLRTIMRDIDDLTLAGIPLYVAKGKNGGIFMMENFKTDKPPLTNIELSSIENSLKSRYQVLGDNSTFNAILKLNKTNLNSDFEIDLSLSQGNLELRKVVFQLLNSIRKNIRITFEYINSKGEQSKKNCEPYRIVYKDRSWYLDAHDNTNDRFSVYKIARISGIVFHEVFEKRNFTPTPYDGGIWINKDKIPVTLYVNKIVIDRFIELIGNNFIKKIDNDIYEVIYPLHDNEWGYNVLLGYGKYVEVISPEIFKNNFVLYLDNIRELYSK